MTADNVPVSSLVTPAEVARTRSLLIPAGDAVPATHTPSAAVPDRKVTTITTAAAPLPLTANQPPSRAAVVPWWSLLLSVLALAALGAVTAITELSAVVGAATAVVLAGCCLVLVVAELVHRIGSVRSRR